jgi:hypothetical protein
MSYARYKFNKAVKSLNEAGARRLEWLGSDNAFRLMRLTPADVPIELRQEFQLFQQEMKPILRFSEMDARQWGIARTLDEATAGRIIDRMMHMHEVIETHHEQTPIQSSIQSPLSQEA